MVTPRHAGGFAVAPPAADPPRPGVARAPLKDGVADMGERQRGALRTLGVSFEIVMNDNGSRRLIRIAVLPESFAPASSHGVRFAGVPCPAALWTTRQRTATLPRVILRTGIERLLTLSAERQSGAGCRGWRSA